MRPFHHRLPALVTAAVCVVGWAASAQTNLGGGKVYRLGVLSLWDPLQPPGIGRAPDLRSVTLAELARRGFVEGHNLVVEVRFGTTERLSDLARELVAWNPDVIVAMGGPTVRALRAISNTRPVVMSVAGDPVAEGFVSSMARPGGNVTGLITPGPDVQGKRLQLLLEAVPGARRVAGLFRSLPADESPIESLRAQAETLGSDLLVYRAAGADDYAGIFAAMRAAGAEAVTIYDAAEFFRDAVRLADLALRVGLPSICAFADMARVGCLLGYGLDLIEMHRRTADYVTRILQGTPPGELPIEAATHFEFAVNLKTARALGLTIPPEILARADEVIE